MTQPAEAARIRQVAVRARIILRNKASITFPLNNVLITP
jgi:hypothetical protein